MFYCSVSETGVLSIELRLKTTVSDIIYYLIVSNVIGLTGLLTYILGYVIVLNVLPNLLTLVNTHIILYYSSVIFYTIISLHWSFKLLTTSI